MDPAQFSELWAVATPWDTYLRPGMESALLWHAVLGRTRIPGWALEAVASSPIRKLLILAADWCGDAANAVPVLARLAEQSGVELRVLERDEFPEVMDRYLTEGTRSIPIAIALDADFREVRHWGPRPEALQVWMLANRDRIPTPQRYDYAMKWYARDAGETMLRELLRTPTHSPSRR